MNETTGGHQRRGWYRARARAGVLAVTVGLMLLTACAGSPSYSSQSSTGTGSAYATRLAFVRCVRAHGVPTYPDPMSNGQEPPGTKLQFLSNPRFGAAVDACRYLLPNGGQQTVTPQAGAMTDASAVKLAGCLRAHGYPAFPDPTINAVGQPVFNVQAAGIAPHSPQILAAIRRCLSRLHLSGLPQTST